MKIFDTNSKKSTKFNVHIVEDHNDALESIYKEIGAKRLNFTNLTLIHFDSHPDLCLPKQLNANLIFDKNYLLNNVNIESWILPAVYAGHINKIIWIKPEWSKQINCGKYSFFIGKHKINSKLHVTCKISYFLSELLYSSIDNLTDTKHVDLYVCELKELIHSKGSSEIRDLITDQIGNPKSVILDIDLDYFSTLNPFKELLNDEYSYDLFKRIYLNGLPQLNFLNDDEFDFKMKYETYAEEKLRKSSEILNLMQSTCDLNRDISEFKQLVTERNLDLDVLHSFGEGLDLIDLPHHRSTIDEFKQFFQCFEMFLNSYFKHVNQIPSLITIARSSLDDYCPPDQVGFIQDDILKIIKECFNTNSIGSINYDY